MSALSNLFNRAKNNNRAMVALTLSGWLAVPVGMHLTHETDRKEERFIVLSDGNIYYISGAGTFEDADEFREEEANRATTYLLNRNPYGLDEAKGVERMFNAAMIQNIHKDLDDRKAAFQQQQIHWKFEPSKVQYLYINSEQFAMSVYGQVVVNQALDGRPLTRSDGVKVNYTFGRNREPAPGWKRPFVVTRYDIFWTDQPQQIAKSR
jgi:hypothetical protein